MMDGQLNQCLSDEKVRDIIFKEKAEGTAKGVSSTPCFFVNDKMVVGTKSLEEELQRYFGAPAAPAAAPAAATAAGATDAPNAAGESGGAGGTSH